MLIIQVCNEHEDPTFVMNTHKTENKVVKAIFKDVIPKLFTEGHYKDREDIPRDILRFLSQIKGDKYRPVKNNKLRAECLISIMVTRVWTGGANGTYRYSYSVKIDDC